MSDMILLRVREDEFNGELSKHDFGFRYEGDISEWGRKPQIGEVEAILGFCKHRECLTQYRHQEVLINDNDGIVRVTDWVRKESGEVVYAQTDTSIFS